MGEETPMSSRADRPDERGGGDGSQSALQLLAWAWLSPWLVVWVGSSVGANQALHGVVNGWLVALEFFLAINVLICVWDISLYDRIGDIERWRHEYNTFRARSSLGYHPPATRNALSWVVNFPAAAATVPGKTALSM